MGKQLETQLGLAKRLDVRIRHGWRGFDLHSQIERIAGLGFKGIELFVDGAGHGDLGGTSRFHLLQVRKTIERYDMRCTLNTAATHPVELRRIIELAVVIGAARIRTNIGGGPDGDPVDPAQVCRDLRAVSTLLARHDICLVINGGRRLPDDHLEAILGDLGHPLIQGERSAVTAGLPEDQEHDRPGLLAAILEMRQQIKQGRFVAPTPPWAASA